MHPTSSTARTSLLNRLVFVEAQPSGRQIAGTETRSIVTVLLKHRRLVSPRSWSQALQAGIGPAIASRRDEWGIDRVRLYAPVPLSRPIVLFLELTRRYHNAKWLCHLRGQAPPPRYRLSLCPRYDAILQIRFSNTLRPDAVAGLRALLDDAGVFERPVMLGSGLQVQVYDARSESDVAKRINLCFLIRRLPGMSREACQRYWRHEHAALALDTLQYNPLTRYRQVHSLPTPTMGLDDDYDGVVFAEKASLGTTVRELSKLITPLRYNARVVADESRFTYATPVMLMRLTGSW
jgi:hypothetical protein